MSKRLSKRLLSDFITPFDVKTAGSIIHSMDFALTEGYAVLSVITFGNENYFNIIKSHKRHIFSIKNQEIYEYSVDGNSDVLNDEGFSKFLAKKLKCPKNDEEVVLVLNVYNETIDDDKPLEWPTINRIPDGIYTWKIEDFLGLSAESLYSKSASSFPPGISLDEEGEIVNDFENDDDYHINLVLPKAASNDADMLLSDIMEYCYDGKHMLSILWDEDVKNCERFDNLMNKKDGKLTLVLGDLMEDAITRNMMIQNMDYKMDTNGKFNLILMSTSTPEDIDGAKVEVRGWDINGKDVRSLDDQEVKSFVSKRYGSEITEQENIIFCDSWDYPVTKVSTVVSA